MSNQKKLVGKVHIVFDYSTDRILGVYLTRKMAYGKVAKEQGKTMELHSNYAVLEFAIQGLDVWDSARIWRAAHYAKY